MRDGFVYSFLCGVVLGFIVMAVILADGDKSAEIAQWGCNHYAKSVGAPDKGRFIPGTGCIVGLPDGHLLIDKVPW